ncbi:MAG: hypothetical protein U9Q77_11200 [Candidatus Marinimicrobia bacterium]|nr:hypothetical protein [Candidatus Neomarinimicrobiota bacterium]
MGKMILIVVLGFIMIFGYIRGNLNRTAEKAIDNASEFAEEAQRNQLVASALEYALSTYIQTGNTDTTIVDSSWLEGVITATIALQGQDDLNNIDTVILSATSEVNGIIDSSQIVLVSHSLLIPPITASVGIDSESATFSFHGNVRIYGNDTNMDGTTGPNDDLSGITVSNSADSTTLADDYAGTTYVQGTGTSPSVSVSDGGTTDLQSTVDSYAGIADQSLLDCSGLDGGSEGDPTIAHIDGDCSLSGNLTGYGVLVIEGSLRMRGRVTWNGLVIVVGESSMEFDVSGRPAIYGSLLLSSPETNLSLSGTADLYYSSEAIQMVQTALEDGGRNRRQLTDVSWWE